MRLLDKVSFKGNIEKNEIKISKDKRLNNRLQKITAYAKLRLKWRPQSFLMSLVMSLKKHPAKLPLASKRVAKSEIPFKTLNRSSY